VRLYVAILVTLVSTGCHKPVDPDSPDNWLNLFRDYPPTRHVNLWLPASDMSCLTNGQTLVLGNVDGQSIYQLATLTRERYPQDAVVSISANGPYAEVRTGRECRPDTESGEGQFLWFRFESGKWKFKDEDRWVG
jgi:hypothetical protein